MNNTQALATLSTDHGVEVTSFAVELASASNNHVNRLLDDFFAVELWYQDNQDHSERKWSFTLKKESEHWDILATVIQELDTINVHCCAYDCVIDVVAESCEILLQEVRHVGRKSLAMVVKIKVDDEFMVDDDDDHDDDDDDDDYNDDDDAGDANDDDDMYLYPEYGEDDGVEAEEVKNFLSSNGGVRFTSGDQINMDIGCCSICLEEFEKWQNSKNDHHQVAVLPCSHVLHGDCLVPWVLKGKNTCPLCRFNLLP